MIYNTLFYLVIATCLLRAIVRTNGGLHILQLDGYKTRRYLKWMGAHLKNCFDIKEILAISCLLGITFIYPQYQQTWFFAPLCIAWGTLQVYLLFEKKKVETKKPLVYTARAKRLLGFSLCLLVGLSVVLVLVAKTHPWRVGLFLFSEVAAINLTIANLLIYPLERTINSGYLLSAKRRIKTLRPKVIGITGSYGKTSTKAILQQILSQKFNTLMTPDSYNTPMGICKVIRGTLNEEHEIFIVEMGAYRRGDIKELCKLVRPEVGILTAVGLQHLERFKNVENITKAKYELIESLPPDGIAVFNCDNDICAKLADTTENRKVLRYGINPIATQTTNTLTATNIQQTDKGLAFTVHNRSQNVEIRTPLLGRHNVSNILAAMTVAAECGMTLDEMSAAVANLEPVPHRLQLTAGAGGVTIIDDSFNANPVGAKAALEVLNDIAQSRENAHSKKVLVTPGMVELGEKEYASNRRFGIQAAEVCDLVILVGPARTAPIVDGLNSANYPREQLIIALNLTEVTQYLKKLLKPGDIVLFENDLPDTYNE